MGGEYDPDSPACLSGTPREPLGVSLEIILKIPPDLGVEAPLGVVVPVADGTVVSATGAVVPAEVVEVAAAGVVDSLLQPVIKRPQTRISTMVKNSSFFTISSFVINVCY